MKKTQINRVAKANLSYIGEYGDQLHQASCLFGFGKKGKAFRKAIRDYREKWYRRAAGDFAEGMGKLRKNLANMACEIAIDNNIALTEKYLAQICFRTNKISIKAKLYVMRVQGYNAKFLVKETKNAA